MADIPSDIINRAAQSDIKAFEEIYSSTKGFVYNVVLRITNNDADAQEVTQDVFVKVFKSLKDFKFRSSFKTWVYRIAVNTALNKYKMNSREFNRRVEYDDVAPTLASPIQVQMSIDKEDAEKRVASLLNILSLEQRTCIILREIEGLSYKEMSETLKVNINTIRSRLKRARLALMDYGKAGGVHNEL